MGVQNLWVLLAPVGRQIEIESLATKVLAVDASIWLTQFIKAMRDDEGKMLANAHLVGTLHRVAKLLFYRIKPVFVFDGQTPELKKKTVARRRKRHESQAFNLRQTAQRLLINHLRMKREQLKKQKQRQQNSSAVAAQFVVPEQLTTAHASDEQVETMSIEQANPLSNASGQAKTSGTSSMDEHESPANTQQQKRLDEEQDSSGNQDDEEEQWVNADEVDLGRDVSQVDFDTIFHLPAHTQKEMIMRIMQQRRQEARDTFLPLAGNPEEYSRAQLQSFLATSRLNRRMQQARARAFAVEEDTAHQPGGFAHRSAPAPRPSDEVGPRAETIPARMDEVTTTKDFISLAERAATIRAEQETEVQKEHAAGSRANPLVLSDGSLDNDEVKIGEKQNKTKQTTKKQTEPEPEPMKKEKESFAQVVISFKEEEVHKVDDQFKELFPASIFEEKTTNQQENTGKEVDEEEDNDEDVEWEDVDALAAEQKKAHQVDEDEEDTVEWEDVDTAVVSKVHIEAPVSGKANMKNQTGSRGSPTDKQQPEDEEKEQEQERGQMFLALLKDELEEEKAQRDLEILRDEALNSALTTASNLTQWAAGAVRRAIQAHTLKTRGKATNLLLEKESIDQHQSQRQEEAKDKEEEPDEDVEEEEMLRQAIAESLAEREIPTSRHETLEEEQEEEKEEESKATEEQDHRSNAVDVTTARYLTYNTPDSFASTKPRLTSSADPEDEEEEQVEHELKALEHEQQVLKRARFRQLRDVEALNEEMVAEVMQLLQLFGVPFLVCPMEAEAQCAALEKMGLVDGIITDDSDIFCFGGQNVYKNIFHNQKFVEAFSAKDIEGELGFTQDEMIALALLLGSDYTEGVHGVGIVNATEIVNAFPGLEGLHEFKQWVEEFDVAREALGDGKSKLSADQLEELSAKERFKHTHASIRRKWEVGELFPNQHVIRAYKEPQVDKSDAQFSWAVPDVEGLRRLCLDTLGWDQARTEGLLKPLVDQAATRSRGFQTRIDTFFTKYEDNVKYAKFRSKRLRMAVEEKSSKKKPKTK